MAAACAQLLSVQLQRGVAPAHSLWLPGAVLMCALLALPRHAWWRAGLAAWVGTVGVLLVLGAPALASAVIVLGHFLLVVPATYLLAQWSRQKPLESHRWLALFVAVAGIALPVLCASWAMHASRQFGLQAHLGGWSNIVLAHSASYLLLVPAYLSLREVAAQSVHRPGRTWGTLALIAVVAVVLGITCWMTLAHSPLLQPLLLLVSFTLVVWSLLLLGAAGAFTALLALALAYMQASLLDPSPVGIGHGPAAVMAIQLWTIALALALLPVAVVAEQRLSLRTSLLDARGRLGDLAGRMLVVQEEERARIARDLHDDINQSLAAISIQVSALKSTLQGPEREGLSDIQQQILAVSGDVRQLSHNLHPSVLRYTSLATSLLSLCETHGIDERLRVACEIHDDMPLADAQKINLFRITEEAIHNIQRHAFARHAWVSLARSGHEVVLRVDDDGIGMPEDMRQRVGSGLGMLSMEERARGLGGRFKAGRRPGGGSRVEVRVPLEGIGAIAGNAGDAPSTGSPS